MLVGMCLRHIVQVVVVSMGLGFVGSCTNPDQESSFDDGRLRQLPEE